MAHKKTSTKAARTNAAAPEFVVDTPQATPLSHVIAAASQAAEAASAPESAQAAPVAAAEPVTEIAPAAAASVTQAADKILEDTTHALNEGTKTMQTETNQVADRVQAVFGDVNERAKTAIERNTRIADEFTDLGKGNVEALVTSSKIAAKGVETLGQEVAEFGRKSFEEASAALKSFAEIKSPADLFRMQGDFARTQFDSLVAESSKLSETMLKLAGDVMEPLSSRYSVNAERVKSAVSF